VLGFHTRLQGTSDLARALGSSVCIIADRAGASSSEWQGEPGLAQIAALAPYAGDAPIVFAGASQAELLADAARDRRLGNDRLLGSSPEALVAAVRAIVAMEARCSPSEVILSVLGAPPDGFVIPWTEASIGGYALLDVLTPVQLTKAEERAGRLWPPACYALGLAAATAAEAIVRSGRRAISVLTVLDGEFGVRGRVGALPALLSPTGIVHRRVPSLSVRERVRLETALGA
jgi:hypothetical protein